MKQFLESKYTSKSAKATKDSKDSCGTSGSGNTTTSSNKAELDEKRRALEQQLDQMAVQETERVRFREVFAKAEADAQKDQRRRLSSDDFEPLALIGRGAYGEVRLVRMKERFSRDIYAMKSMPKESMIIKNQVTHVRAERDILTQAAESNPWIVVLYYTFQVCHPSSYTAQSSNHIYHSYARIFCYQGRAQSLHGYGVSSRRRPYGAADA
jgi:serine/threonine protein kinase